MNELLARVLEAHGGLDRWMDCEKVEATFVSGGGFFSLKGSPSDTSPRRATAWLHEERLTIHPYGAADQRSMFAPGRIAIEKLDGTVIAERRAPKDSFAGHQMNTPWDRLHRAYFTGEAVWTYLTTPFLLAMEGVQVEETDSWQEGAETWRVLRAYFPGSIDTHSLIQDFFFDDDLKLRRYDYNANLAGGFGATQVVSDYVAVNGFQLPTRRRVYTRGPDRRPVLEMPMVFIDFSEIRFVERELSSETAASKESPALAC